MSMKPFKTLISREAALELIIEYTHPTKKNEEILLTEGRGRVLADKAVAELCDDAFDAAADMGRKVVGQHQDPQPRHRNGLPFSRGAGAPGAAGFRCRLARREASTRRDGGRTGWGPRHTEP